MLDENYSSNPQEIKNSTKFINEKLWRPSQTTLNFASPRVSFTRQERFKLHSIYWPQKQTNPIIRMNKQRSQIEQIARKISKQIDQQQKNEKRMKIEIKNKSLKSSKKNFSKKKSLQKKTGLKLSDQNERIIKRLGTTFPKRQSSLRDRHGNRSNLFEEDQELFPFLRTQFVKLNSSTGFKTSRRVDLNLPHNYYPGPGTYQIKRYLEKINKQKN